MGIEAPKKYVLVRTCPKTGRRSWYGRYPVMSYGQTRHRVGWGTKALSLKFYFDDALTKFLALGVPNLTIEEV